MTIQSRANALSTQLRFRMCVVAIYVENERSRSRSPRGSECCAADSQDETEGGPASHCTAEIAAHAVARKGSSTDPLQRRDHVGGLFLASACCVRLSWAVSRSQVFSVTPRSRSLYFCTLPLSVVGSSRTNSRYRGIAK